MSVTYIQTGPLLTPPKTSSRLASFARRIAAYFYVNSLTNYSQPNLELQNAGLTSFQLSRPIVARITTLLWPNEHVKAAFYGHVPGAGVAVAVATESRILFAHDDSIEDFSYDNLTLLSGHSGALLNVTMVANHKTYNLGSIRNESAEQFVRYVESHLSTRVIPRYKGWGSEVPVPKKALV